MLNKSTTSKIVLALTIGMLVAPIQGVHASENKNIQGTENTQSIQIKTNDIKNLKMLKETDTELVYTYEQNNQTFKTEEFISKNQVISKVYKMNLDGSFVKMDEVKTSIDENKKQIIQEVNGQKDIIPLNEYVEEVNENVVRSARANRPPQNTWVYIRTDKGSNKYKKFLLGAGAISLSALLKVPYSAALQILNLGVALNLDTVYYTTKVYYKYRGFLAVEAKYVSNVYSDSARRNLIKSNVVGYQRLTR
ncbi:hypothetical protein ACFLKC_13945 [Clostridium caseinilyticum]|uniref:hypothetical protein n=1 Tax=Clostridium caseinilyticum TaxID=3350403 RepID=UPI0038F61101